MLTAPDLPWVALEVQHDIDEVKRRRWPLVAGVLLDEHKAMGELVVLTTQRRVARWAARAVRWVGRLGTRLSLTPLVLRVDLDAAFDLGAYTRHIDTIFARLEALKEEPLHA